MFKTTAYYILFIVFLALSSRYQGTQKNTSVYYRGKWTLLSFALNTKAQIQMSLISAFPSQYSILLPRFRSELPPTFLDHSRTSVLFLYQENLIIPSEVLLYNLSLIIPSPCVSMYLLVGWLFLFFFVKDF